MLILFTAWYLFYPTPPHRQHNQVKDEVKKVNRSFNVSTKKFPQDNSLLQKNKDKNLFLERCQKSKVSVETASELFDELSFQCKESDSRLYDLKSIELFNDFCKQSDFSTNRKNICMKKILENRELLLRFIDRNLIEIDSFNWEFIKRILINIGVNIDSRGGRILYDLVFQSSDSELKKRLTFMYIAAAVKKLDTSDGILQLETARLEDVFNIEENAGTLLDKKKE